MAKKKTGIKKAAPVIITGGTFGEMISDFTKQKPSKPLTKKEQDEVNDLLKQLRKSQGPGDALLEIRW